MKKAFYERKKIFRDLLKEIPGFEVNDPDGAFYIFPDISSYFGKTNGKYKIENSADFVDVILNEAHVSIVPGSAFGAPKCIRFSYATSEDNIKEVANRIRRVLADFK